MKPRVGRVLRTPLQIATQLAYAGPHRACAAELIPIPGEHFPYRGQRPEAGETLGLHAIGEGMRGNRQRTTGESLCGLVLWPQTSRRDLKRLIPVALSELLEEEGESGEQGLGDVEGKGQRADERDVEH